MNSSPRIKVHIKCSNCGGKILEGAQFRNTIELSCLMCGWRTEPFIEQWEKTKKKVYEQMLNERNRKVTK
jgi:ribosomal protein L37E